MAYLSAFRKHDVRGTWSPIPSAQESPELNHLLDLADDTLNSWKIAHQIFDRWQGDDRHVNGTAFQLMKAQVHRVIRDALCNTASSYDNEAVTYALLKRWIEVRQEQLKIDRRKNHAQD